MLLLLARLGLRASEVAQLKFADIDWRNGSITVCGKGRRQESLPLPQEVGNAILLYLNQGRPSLRAPEVFTTVLAPIRPLTRAAVTHIVRAALRRAGIKAPDQRCSRPAALRRHYHAPSRCIPGRRRCGPATPLSHDDGSLRQGGLRSPVGDRSAMAGGVLMLIATLNATFRFARHSATSFARLSGNLRAFARFAADRGDTHVRISTAVDWATEAPSPHARHIRLRDVAHLARFLHAEDPTHEVPSNPFHASTRRPCPTSTHRRRLCNSSERPVGFASRTRFDAKSTDIARADCRDRAPHFGGARPPAP